MTKNDKKTATEISKQNNKIVRDVIVSLTNIRADFDVAENEYQSAKGRIYTVLSRVFEQYVAIKVAIQNADKKNKQTLRELFEKKVSDLNDERSIVATAATSLELRVMRVVTGSAFKLEREKAYARVLRIAFDEKIHEDEAMSFADWIVGAGGIEEVRRSGKAGSKQNEAAEAARVEYTATTASAQLPTSFANKFVKVENSDPNFAVALVRKNADGTLSLVATADSKGAVTAMLKALGKGKTVAYAEKVAAEAAAKRAAKVAAATKQMLSAAATSAASLMEAA
jgi:hypothetical protein